MNTFFLKTIVFVLTIVFIMFVLVILRLIIPFEEIPMKQEVFTPKNFKTGDILIVEYPESFFRTLFELFTGTRWSHTGLIWRDPTTNIPYVLEQANYFGEYSGYFSIPLYLWFYINKKCRICKIPINREIDPNRVMNFFKPFIRKRSDLDSYKNMLRHLTKDIFHKIKPREYKEKGYTCLEVVIHILQEVGVFKKQYTPHSYMPIEIIRRTIPTEDGFKYLQPILVINNCLSFVSKMD